MSKILATQINGLLQKIIQEEEFNIEETARLLAQASIGQGHVYFACFGELRAVEYNALYGAEPFHKLLPWASDIELTEADRICIFTRNCQNESALKLAQHLSDNFIPFAVVAAEKAGYDNELSNLAYTYVSTNLHKGLLPNDYGERIVLPHTIAALFVYEAIKLTYDEMLSTDNELD